MHMLIFAHIQSFNIQEIWVFFFFFNLQNSAHACIDTICIWFSNQLENDDFTKIKIDWSDITIKRMQKWAYMKNEIEVDEDED